MTLDEMIDGLKLLLANPEIGCVYMEHPFSRDADVFLREVLESLASEKWGPRTIEMLYAQPQPEQT